MSSMIHESIKALEEEPQDVRRQEQTQVTRLVNSYLRHELTLAKKEATKPPDEFDNPNWPAAYEEIVRLLEYLLKVPR